jgi:hypothetical protein
MCIFCMMVRWNRNRNSRTVFINEWKKSISPQYEYELSWDWLSKVELAIAGVSFLSIYSMNSLNDYEQCSSEHSEYDQCEWLWTMRVWAWRLESMTSYGCDHDEYEQCEWLWTVRVWAWWVWTVWMITNSEGVIMMSMNSVNEYEQWWCEHDE